MFTASRAPRRFINNKGPVPSCHPRRLNPAGFQEGFKGAGGCADGTAVRRAARGRHCARQRLRPTLPPGGPGEEGAARSKMAVAGPASAAGRLPARPRPGLARFRGCLAGALLGDCLGAVFEGRSVVKLPELLSFLKGLEPAPPEEGGEAAGSARGGAWGAARWGAGDIPRCPLHTPRCARHSAPLRFGLDSSTPQD